MSELGSDHLWTMLANISAIMEVVLRDFNRYYSVMGAKTKHGKAHRKKIHMGTRENVCSCLWDATAGAIMVQHHQTATNICVSQLRSDKHGEVEVKKNLLHCF